MPLLPTPETLPLQQFRATFQCLKREFDTTRLRIPGLICTESFSGGCPGLKLQKTSWTTPDRRDALNPTGIFFSAWLDEAGVRLRRGHYGLHALRLQHLPGYTGTSIEFCNAFRRKFAAARRAWPNVSTDFGCLTLMQGWFALDRQSFARSVLELLDRFQELCPVIDDLLAQRAKLPARRRPTRAKPA